MRRFGRRPARRAALRAVASARAARVRRRSTNRCTQLLNDQPSIAIGIIGQEIIVGDMPLPRAAEIDGRNDPAAEVARHRAHRLRARRHAGGAADAGADHRAPGAPARTGRRRASSPPIRWRCSAACRTSASAASRPKRRRRTSAADIATIRRLYSDATNVAGTVWEMAQDRRHARSEGGARAGRLARAGGGAEPHRADRADRAEELRQLHVHAHGERLDPHDGAGARARHRRRAAARVRPRRADARHRQGAHADRDPEQARQADRRRVRRSCACTSSTAPRSCAARRRCRRSRRWSRSSTTCASTAPATRSASRAAA